MSSTLETFTLDQLTPAQAPHTALEAAIQLGASLTLLKGTAMSIKTSDNKGYPLNSTTAGTNEVQTVNFNIASTGGTVVFVVPKANGTMVQTVGAAWSATDATYLSNVNSALDTATGVSGGIVATAIASVDTDLGFVLTFSGTGYAGLPQAMVRVDGTLPTSTTGWNVVRTTAGGISDGTQTFKGFLSYNVATDANGKVYFVSSPLTAAASYRQAGVSTANVWVSGIFDPQDLVTNTTVKEVDTFTASNPTTADVYKITITYPDLTTYSVSATVGATQTATAIDTLLIAAWNADATASQYAVASGTTTLIMTAVIGGNILNLSGSVVGTGTIAKVVTTAGAGRAIGDISPSLPGIQVLPNGFWKI